MILEELARSKKLIQQLQDELSQKEEQMNETKQQLEESQKLNQSLISDNSMVKSQGVDKLK